MSIRETKKHHTICLEQKDYKSFEKRERARFINSLHGPRPASLVGTVGKEKIENLSIISSVFHLGADPALVGMILRPDVVARDTLTNIRQTSSYTINQVNVDIYEKAHQTSARYPRDISEFKVTALTAEYRDKFLAPFVAESSLKYSVNFLREKKMKENGTHLIIGEIQNIYLPEMALRPDKSISLNDLSTVAVNGLDHYFTLTHLDRLSYAKPDRPLTSIRF